jgi:uncharacterized protein (TIGR02145 family)
MYIKIIRSACLLLLFVAAFAIFKSCKKDSSDKNNSDPAGSLKEVVDLLDALQDFYISQVQSNGGQSYPALEASLNWLQTRDEVDQAVLMDDKLIMIYLRSGLSTWFLLDFKDASGISVYRGGGGGSSLSAMSSGGPCSNVMANKKVLMYVAMNKEFYAPGELQQVLDHFSTSSEPLTVTTLLDSQCTPQVVSTFGNYGLVIMDTHGFPNGFCTGVRITFDSLNTTEAQFRSTVESQVGAGSTARFLNGEWSLGWDVKIDTTDPGWATQLKRSRKYWASVNSRHINTLPSWDETIVFGNMCYSGTGNIPVIKDPIQPAISNRQPVTYYCYRRIDNEKAYAVDNGFAQRMEDSLVKALVIDFDSTGIAHLHPSGSIYTDTAVCLRNGTTDRCNSFLQIGAPNYCYGCGGSITDARDGNTYKTVCIGSQIWMAENLRYSDNSLTEITDSATWVALWNNGNPISQPAWCYYNNNPANSALYGKLYNWHAVNTGQLCPVGWHIPSDMEWKQLIDSLGGKTAAGGKLKSITGWDPPNTNASNSTGFSALPGGIRSLNDGNFTELGLNGYWWSSTTMPTLTTQAYFLRITNNPGWADRINANKLSGMSCRCVKD